MLKIRRRQDGEAVALQLSGRITLNDLPELEHLIDRERVYVVVLDLAHVTLVDLEAVGFLARCEGAGIAITHCPGYIRGWIEKEREHEAANRGGIARPPRSESET